MKHYNIAFVGLGSIGTRHFHNLCSVLDSKGFKYSIDLYRSNLAKELPSDVEDIVNTQYLSGDKILMEKQYDIVFVTNPTFLHLNTVLHFFDHTKSFFIEKPVFDSYEIDDEVVRKIDSKVSYVSCPMRFNPVIQYVRNNIDCSKAISVRAISSSYLPDWRPGQDYRSCYSAKTDMGGGVDIDLIHEWDYLTFLFGMPNQCHSILGKFSHLEIDSNDTAIYIARNNQTTFELHLDYYGKKAIRTLDIFLPNETVHCDMLNGYIELLKSGERKSFEKDRNFFHIAQIKHFIDIVEGCSNNDSTVSHAVKILKLTKGFV